MGPARNSTYWIWSFIAVSAVALFFIVSETVSTLNGDARFWEVARYWNGEPFVLVAGEPRPGGAGARAGIQKGDRIDLRAQTPAMRWDLYRGPRGASPMKLVVRRDNRAVTLRFVGGTVWEGATATKLLNQIVAAVADLCFLGCGLLIALRRSALTEARWLALVLLCLAFGSSWTSPYAGPVVIVLFILPVLPLALLAGLSARFGTPNAWRSTSQWATYATVAACIIMNAIGWYGWVTARFDAFPLFGGYSTPSIVVNDAAAVFALVAVAGAVTSTPRTERARAGWLLLPLTVALCMNVFAVFFVNYAPSWIVYASIGLLASAFVLAGALLVTYAILRRRVIDIGFVVSRTIVVGIMSVTVIAAFVLLEWALGTLLNGASHTSGLFANAALALVLGLSMRYFHKRVDSFVDAVMFRRRHEDERALRAFASEASFVTNTDALYDLAIGKVRAHTNATGAALLMNGNGIYRNVRAFGDVPASAAENDPAILALKTWHSPLDPHAYETALTGDLAVPIVARGQLHGVLLFEPRASGEAYAPDEIEALSEFAHGIGSAYDALAGRAVESNATASAINALRETIERRFGSLQ